jgi:two-component system response regulator HydG
VRANGGTIFLDEIGEMPPSLQPKLLRVLQERSVRPLGGDSEIRTDVRLITATNRDLEQHILEGRFREDLFYRINVIQIPVPPLRERGSDILLLAQHYAEHFALLADKPVSGLSPAANRKLLAYPWPGNVRELQNSMERAVALTKHHEIQVTDLPERIRSHRAANVLVVGTEPSELVPMHEVERRYIARVLDAVAGNKREAARILGFDRKTLYRKLERYGLRESSAKKP